MSLRVGIISYLPDNDKRSARLSVAKEAISNIQSIIPDNVQATIIAQNYSNEKLLGDQINYKFYSKLGKCTARNTLLEDFYNSDDDFMLYTDDDTYCLNTNNVKKLFEDIHRRPEMFKGIDSISGINNPNDDPFLDDYIDKTDLYNIYRNYMVESNKVYNFRSQYIFRTMEDMLGGGEFRILRNLKKYYGKEFYYDSDDLVLEDIHFFLTKLRQINAFMCRNIMLKNLGMVSLYDRFNDRKMLRVKYNFATRRLMDDFLTPVTRKFPQFAINIKTGKRKLVKDNIGSYADFCNLNRDHRGKM